MDKSIRNFTLSESGCSFFQPEAEGAEVAPRGADRDDSEYSRPAGYDDAPAGRGGGGDEGGGGEEIPF